MSSADDDLEVRVLDAAADLLAEQQGALSLSELAQRVGVSRGTLYRRFGNRDALLARVRAERQIAAHPPVNTRERILDAVSELVGQLGPVATTLEKVAECAGVSMMSIYRHFGDRASLLRAFVEERTPRRSLGLLATNARSAPTDGPGDIESTLTGFLTEVVGFIARNPALVRAELAPDQQTEDLFAEVRQHNESSRVALTRYLQTQIDRGHLFADPATGMGARAMATALFGMVVIFAHMNRQQALDDPAAIAGFITRTLLRGWAGPGQPASSQPISGPGSEPS